MTSLLLCLSGPLQSWGVGSTHDHRGTEPVPTLSAVTGMLSAAQGLPRDIAHQWVDDNLQFAARVDMRGTVMTDYHTVNADKRIINYEGNSHKETVQTWRGYLNDAVFTVAITHPNTDLINTLAHATQHPVWTPSLGRRACLPNLPLYLGVTDTPLTTDFWQTLPVIARAATSADKSVTVNLHSTTDPDNLSAVWINDQPHRYGIRTRSHRGRPTALTRLTIPTRLFATPGKTASSDLLAQHAAVRAALT